jgi:hypothetical protein
MKRFLLGAGCLMLSAATAEAAELRPETIAAWNRYVAKAETRLHRTRATEPQGRYIDVPGGTIYHWRGSTIVRGTTVDRVVHRLTHPGTPPPQEDVLESRVLSRRGDNDLHVYLKLARSVLVTVVYDTEHDVAFQRPSARMATSRSVSTRIAESGGNDRGFLWRLNSYWRYTQVGRDVLIELESLSLSRDVPRVARPIAVPIANRIARESVARTLGSVRAFLES